jgi:D-glycero-alpha-D-manno-heptose 1-phosphate guanylyltransferase
LVADKSFPDVVILCGGIGSRLQPLVSDRPKALALIDGRPFLDILIDELVLQGACRIILCVGYMRKMIIENYSNRRNVCLEFSEEIDPLGTGGAVRNALNIIKSDPFIVMNGDSYCPINFKSLLEDHSNRNSSASIVLAPNDLSRADVGCVVIDQSKLITSFDEKGTDRDNTYTNAGIYVFNKNNWLEPLPNKFSLESDFLPKIVQRRLVSGYLVSGPVCDIGTPDRYRKYSITLPNFQN